MRSCGCVERELHGRRRLLALRDYHAVDSWLEDFRADVSKIDIQVRVVHGTADRILPYANTAPRLPGLIADLKLVPVEGGPHNIGWTHPDEVNSALLEFLGAAVTV